MPTLRDDPLFRRSTVTDEDLTRLDAAGMTEFGRAYEAGRISDETNPMLADIARLRTSQDQADLARADELQQQVDALKLRQEVYAPAVGRVEDINSLGSAADWAAYQIGSGIASMQDPLAVSAGLQGAANLTSKGPGILKPVSAGLRGAGYAVPYLMGREQLIGENYGQMTEDPTLMQNTTAQQRYDAANLAGSTGAVLDTVVPGYIGGKLAGNGLRQGIARTGMGTRAGLTMGVEGATETGQGELGRMALSDLNPNRDTSGDMSMRLNEFAGGAIGAGPFAVAGAMADDGYRRTGATAETIGTKAGETIDLLSQKTGELTDKVKDLTGKAGDKIDLSAFKGEDGKVDLGKLVSAAREGAVDLGEQARAAATGIDRDPRVMDLLDFDPMDDTKVPQDVALGGPERINQWRNERMALRDEHIFNTLEDLANKGDQRADQLLAAIEEAGGRNDGDGVAMGYLEGRDYLRQSMADEDRRAIQDRAVGLAKLAGKVGAAGVKGAVGFGKAMWDSARGEWKAKKNAQGETDSGFGAILRAELGEGDQGEMAAFADRLADRIELGLAKWKSAPTKGADLKQPYNITALAADLRGTYGERAVQVVEQLAAQQPDMAPGLEALRAEVEAQGTQAGRERAYRARVAAANRVMSLVPAAQRGSLGGSSRMRLLDLVERVAEGSAEPGLRKALTEAVGADALTKMLEVANGITKAKDTQREASMFGDRPGDDGPGQDSDRTENKEEVGDYEKRAAEKRSAQGRAPSLYGFSKTPTLRNSVRDKDIFGPVEKKEKKAAGEKDESVRRPELFKRGQKLASGANAIEARVVAMERYLGVNKDEIDPSDPYLVSPVSALDIMRRLGMQPAKMMALFRDYMRQEAGAEGMDPALAQKYQELAAQAADAVLDQMDAQKGDKKVQRLTEQQLDKLTKDMQRYFSERFVAVAEQLADRVPEKLTAGEIDDLVKRATKDLDKIEGAARKEGGKDSLNRMIAESNTLFFKMKSPKGGAVAVEVPVRVKDLVRWVREQRNMNERWEDDPGGWKKDDVFLADVLSGINAMLASGRMVDALPYMKNNFGKVESFADGIPGSLQLVTKPMWQITKRKEERAEKQAAEKRSNVVDTRSPEYQAKVAEEYGPDATQGENIDAPPADENAPIDWTTESMTAEELTQYEALQTPKERAAFRKALGLRKAGEGFANRSDSKTDDPNATPLDFYPKRKDGEAADERDDALYRTKQGGKSAYSPLDYEPPMTAMGKLLQDRAGRIRRALTGDFVLARELNALGAKATTLKPAQVAEVDRAQRDGVATIINRLRAALRPTYAKQGEVVGGIHYIYPALVALKPENMAAYADAGGSLEWVPEALNDLREQALRIIVDSKLDDAKQLAAIKMMVSDEAAERLNLANFKKYAERNAAPYVSLDELQVMEPRYRDTTRDVSKKPVVPTTREAGVRGEARSLPAGDYRRSKLTAAQEAEYAKLKTQTERDAYLANVANPRPGIKVRKLNPQPVVQQVENAEARAMKYLEYLNNPPVSYEPKHAVGIRRWASTVLAESTDEDVRSAARLLLKKADSVIEGDQSLTALEDTAGSEVPAQGPKSRPAPGGVRNAQSGNGTPSTDKEVAQAKAYIDRVLGPQIKVDFEKTMGHSGEWIEASETIKIALNAAAGIMPTAYHEALHAFFSKYVKSNTKVLNVMKALAENEQVLARVYALLDGYPAAQAQLRDGEERLAYIYQFWAAGQLDLPTPQARTWAQKLMKFFRQVLGRVTAEERAGAILAALHEGKLREPDAAQRVLAELVADKAWTTKARRNFDGLMQGAAALAMPSHSILLESASPTARRLADLFFANPGDESAGGKVGFLNAVRNERTRRTNAIGKAIEGLSEKDQAAVVQYLQQAKDPAQIPFEPHANAVRAIRAELDDFWIYSANAGVDLGRIKDYFPVVWDTEVLIDKREAFIQMLMEHYRPQLEGARASAIEKGVRITLEEAASRLHTVIVDRQVFDGKLAVGREDGVLIPFFESGNNRTLDWIAPEHREPFLDKSLVGTLSRYFHQGVRAAEYTRRFGADGKQLESRLDDVKDELHEASKTEPGLDTADARAKWVQRQYRDVRNAVAAMEGTLGKDITDTHRKINSWMIVYQNIRLLPLSLFSSFVDPLSMVARGADFKTAGEAFLNGLREVFRGWRDMIAGMPKDRQKDEWEKMAEFVGTTESAIFAHYVAETYSSQYMSPRAKRINDMMFKLNGMEAWNRAMRVGATKGAVQFIIKHKDSPEQHSQRWLNELGLTSEDIVVRDGKLIVDKAELMALGMNDQKAEDISMKNKAAINRWVEGAVLTPNSAQRPAWSSDPRWSFLFHLKQFTYSFHQTILKRVWGEIKHGNLAPAGVMAMFIPTMIAADITKGLIQGGGDLPAHMKGMDAGDWVLHGAERSGVLGYGQIGMDTGADWASLAGPSVEQVIDGFRQPIDETIVKALPANPLYREAFR